MLISHNIIKQVAGRDVLLITGWSNNNILCTHTSVVIPKRVILTRYRDAESNDWIILETRGICR